MAGNIFSMLIAAMLLIAVGCSTGPAYPETTDGLRQFAGDLAAAYNENAATLETLSTLLIVPDPDVYFVNVFGEEKGKQIAEGYKTQSAEIKKELPKFFAESISKGQTDIRVTRMDNPDDPEATGLQSRALAAMKNRTALYAVRFVKPGEDAGMAFWSFVYYKGAFRFITKLRGPF
jgi:hypothetical protein